MYRTKKEWNNLGYELKKNAIGISVCKDNYYWIKLYYHTEVKKIKTKKKIINNFYQNSLDLN